MGFPFPVDEAQGGGADASEVFFAWHQVRVAAAAARAGSPGVAAPRVPLTDAMAVHARSRVAQAPVMVGRMSPAAALEAAAMASPMTNVSRMFAARVEAAAAGAPPSAPSAAMRVVADSVVDLRASNGLAERR